VAARGQGCRAAHFERRGTHTLRKITSALLFSALAGAVTLAASVAPRAQETRAAVGQQQQPTLRPGIRLRSFVVGATGSLHFEPSEVGGTVRITVLGLPRPQVLSPGASAFVVWAVAPGSPPIHIGEMGTDAGGNGGLEFARPPSFERYSVIVTAEADASADRPKGDILFASPAGAVAAFYGVKAKKDRAARSRRTRKELKEYARAARGGTDFYGEVEGALAADRGGREVELFGEEVAPEAHGVGHVTARDNKAYLRALFTNVPPPSAVGANAYVLWAVEPGGRITYMGSLLMPDPDGSDVYVRVGNFRSDDFDLFVTAEVRRPAPRPSARRALSTERAR
jgi:hypothetical protein